MQNSSGNSRGTKRTRGEGAEFGPLPDFLAGARAPKRAKVVGASSGTADGGDAVLERLRAENEALRGQNEELQERLTAAEERLQQADEHHTVQIEALREQLEESNADHGAQMAELRREMQQLQRHRDGRGGDGASGRNGDGGAGSSSSGRTQRQRRTYTRPANGQYAKYNVDGSPLDRKYWGNEIILLDKDKIKDSDININREYSKGGMRWDYVEKQNILIPGTDRRPYANILPDDVPVSRSPSPEPEVVTYPERVWYVIPPHCKVEAESYGAVPVDKKDIDQFTTGNSSVKAKYKSQRILHFVEGEEHRGRPLDRNRFKNYSQFNIETGDVLEPGVHRTPADRIARHSKRQVEGR